MEIKRHLATESLSPEAQLVSLGPTTHEPVTYAPPPLSSVQETTELNCYQRRARLKARPAQVTTSILQSPVQQNIQVQSNVQPVSQVYQDQEPIVPNLGPSMFRRSSKRMSLSSNRITNNVPEPPKSHAYTESPGEARLRRIIEDSLWGGTLLTY